MPWPSDFFPLWDRIFFPLPVNFLFFLWPYLGISDCCHALAFSAPQFFFLSEDFVFSAAKKFSFPIFSALSAPAPPASLRRRFGSKPLEQGSVAGGRGLIFHACTCTGAPHFATQKRQNLFHSGVKRAAFAIFRHLKMQKTKIFAAQGAPDPKYSKVMRAGVPF